MGSDQESEEFLKDALGYTDENIHEGYAWLDAQYDRHLELGRGKVYLIGVRFYPFSCLLLSSNTQDL
jgi:hypothetical protein